MHRLARFAVVCSLGVVGLGACGAGPGSPPPLIAVREEVSRSATFPLPLDEASRNSLLMFLAAGGNNDGIEDGALITAVYPDAEARWAKLLQVLSNPANVEVADMHNGTYSAWLKAEPVRQVVDARDRRPNLACPPFAFTQDRFVWIFKCQDSTRLSSVFVQQAIAPRSQ